LEACGSTNSDAENHLNLIKAHFRENSTKQKIVFSITLENKTFNVSQNVHSS
jgi:hypothetical protein